MDVASLGVALDPSQIEKGTLALDKLATSAAKAERSADKIGGAFSKAGREAAAGTGALASAIAGMTGESRDATSALDAVMKKATSLQNAAGRVAGSGHSGALGAVVDSLDTPTATPGANDNKRLQRHEWTNLSRQGQDVLTMAAMGASPMQIASSQGAQIFDALSSSSIGAKAAIADIGSTVAAAITPVRLLGAAFVGAAGVSVAALMRWKTSTDELQQSLDGLGRFSGVSLTDARGLAEQAAGASGLSLRSSQHLVSGALGAGLDASSAGCVASIAKDASIRLGVQFDDIAKELTGAFADPARGAEELARKYGVVTLAQAHHIDELTKVGDRSGAAAELLRDLRGALDKIADRRSPISRLIDRVETGVSDAFTSYGESLAKSQNPFNRSINRLAGVQGNESAATVFGRMRSGELQRNYAQHQADIAGQDIYSVVRETAPDLFARHDLEMQIDKFQRALGRDGVGRVLDDLGVSGDMARQTLERMRAGLDLLQTPLQRVTEANGLALRSAEAETTGQRAQIAAEQAYRAELESSKDRLAAVTAAEGARNIVIAEAAHSMREQVKQSERSADLAALGPYERAAKEAWFRLQDNLKKADTSPGAGADLSIYDKSVVVPFDRAGGAAARLADAMTSAADRIGRLVPTSEWRAPGSASATAPAFAGAGNAYDPRGVAGYVQERAAAYGLNPSAVLRIAQSEGLSQFYGDKGTSFGALQLHTGGGLGDTFRQQTGLDPSDPRNERMTIDWGLRYMAQTRDVSPWHGAARVGVTNADVFGDRAATSSASAIGDQAAQIQKSSAAWREYNAEMRGLKATQVDQWLRSENLSLDDQRRSIDLATGAWGTNKGALAAAEMQQRLLAEAQRQTIPITAELTQKIAELSKKAADNARAQEDQRQRIASYDLVRNSANDVGSSAAIAAFRGQDVGAAAKEALMRAGENMLRQTVSGLTSNLFGAMGSDGLGPIGSLLGINPQGGKQSTQTMNVQTGVLNVAGGVGGSGGLLSGLFGGGSNSNFAGQAAGAMGPFQQGGGDFLSSALSIFGSIGGFFGFADGGLMTGRGALALHRYDKGGIANSPQLAMFGEGRHPEAYIPMPDPRGLNVVIGADGGAHVALPDGRGIPAVLSGAMAGALGASAGTPRVSAFADGGVMTGAGKAPLNLVPRSAAATSSAARQNSGSGVKVTINNNASGDTKATTKLKGDELLVTIDKMMDQRFDAYDDSLLERIVNQQRRR